VLSQDKWPSCISSTNYPQFKDCIGNAISKNDLQAIAIYPAVLQLEALDLVI